MLLDTYAWIEWFQGSEAGATVDRLLQDAPILYTSPIVLAETFSKLKRARGGTEAEQAVEAILERCAVIAIDEAIGIAAGRIHAEMKTTRPDFGMADAFVLASARDRGVQVLTGDPHFRGVQDAILL